MSVELAGKSVVIVGGTSGVGYAIAEATVEFGANMVVVSRTQDNVDKALQRLHASYPEHNSQVRGFVCDLSSPTAEEDITKLLRIRHQQQIQGRRPCYYHGRLAAKHPISE